MNKLRVIFAGGGTGGHLFPALAIANRMKEMVEPKGKAEFRFVGTKKGLEYRMRDKLGFPLSLINVRGLSRAGLVHNILFPFLLFGAIIKSLYLMIRYRPDIVVGTGGYVMGPVMMAAVAMYKRTVIQEQNSYPGLTTRKLATRVDRVFLGFKAAKKHLEMLAETMETGNPVKDIIGKVSKEEARKEYGFSMDDKVILVMGGSQGASSINQNVCDNIDSITDGYKLIWQTGDLNYREITDGLGEKLAGHAVFAFTDRVEYAYAAADIAIARAGALTLAELEAAGLPAILIPYPYAAEDHQRINAEYFAEQSAAIIFDDKELKEYNIPAVAVELLKTGDAEKMAQAVDAMRRSKKKPAVDLIAEEILKIADYEGNDD